MIPNAGNVIGGGAQLWGNNPSALIENGAEADCHNFYDPRIPAWIPAFFVSSPSAFFRLKSHLFLQETCKSALARSKENRHKSLQNWWWKPFQVLNSTRDKAMLLRQWTGFLRFESSEENCWTGRLSAISLHPTCRSAELLEQRNILASTMRFVDTFWRRNTVPSRRLLKLFALDKIEIDQGLKRILILCRAPTFLRISPGWFQILELLGKKQKRLSHLSPLSLSGAKKTQGGKRRKIMCAIYKPRNETSWKFTRKCLTNARTSRREWDEDLKNHENTWLL